MHKDHKHFFRINAGRVTLRDREWLHMECEDCDANYYVDADVFKLSHLYPIILPKEKP